MPNYKKMYFELAGKVADAADLLIKAQQAGEEDYISENIESLKGYINPSNEEISSAK